MSFEHSNSLADLAARIKAELAVAKHMKAGLERAISAGKLLLEAKALLKHGQWLPWLKDHCSIPDRTAQHYMRLARHEDEIRKSADLNITQALEAISPPELDIEYLVGILADGEDLSREGRARLLKRLKPDEVHMLFNLTIIRDLGYLVRDGNGWKACPPELPEHIPGDTTASRSAVEIGRLYRTGCKHIADALDAMKAQGIIA